MIGKYGFRFRIEAPSEAATMRVRLIRVAGAELKPDAVTMTAR